MYELFEGFEGLGDRHGGFGERWVGGVFIIFKGRHHSKHTIYLKRESLAVRSGLVVAMASAIWLLMASAMFRHFQHKK